MYFLVFKTVKETNIRLNNHHTIKVRAYNMNIEKYYENVKKNIHIHPIVTKF